MKAGHFSAKISGQFSAEINTMPFCCGPHRAALFLQHKDKTTDSHHALKAATVGGLLFAC